MKTSSNSSKYKKQSNKIDYNGIYSNETIYFIEEFAHSHLFFALLWNSAPMAH